MASPWVSCTELLLDTVAKGGSASPGSGPWELSALTRLEEGKQYLNGWHCFVEVPGAQAAMLTFPFAPAKGLLGSLAFCIKCPRASPWEAPILLRFYYGKAGKKEKEATCTK